MSASDEFYARARAALPDAEPPRISLTTDGRLVLTHDALVGSGYDTPGIRGAVGTDGRPTPAALRECDEALRDVRRRLRRGEVFSSLDASVDCDRPWRDLDRPPSWATLTHPLFSYALRMNGANDLSGDALATGASPDPGVRVRLVHDLVTGRARLDPAHPGSGEIVCDGRSAILRLEADIPETTRHLLAGRALGALIQLRASGDPHLDAVVSAIPIAHAAPEPGDGAVVTVSMAPVQWVAPADAPRGMAASELRRDAPMR